MKIKRTSDRWQAAGETKNHQARCVHSCHASRVLAALERGEGGTRHGEQGIALVITLIMLAVTLVMAVAFLALSRREQGSVATTTDTTVARLAVDTGMANGEAQIVANYLNGYNGLDSGSAYGFRMIVSTNYINPYGFLTGIGNPTNVNYTYANGNSLSVLDFQQNVSNLWFLPRAPVFVPTNNAQSPVGYDFRYYLDLNENGRYETNGWGFIYSGNSANPYFDANGNLISTTNNAVSMLNVGDPEWIGVLEHPDAPHGPNNHFISRYAFAALPVGNALDVNYIHNQTKNPNLTANDGFMRNQGVGSWEINLAAFLADLNTNIWSPVPLPANLYYSYNETNNLANSGLAFQDALAILKYRYNYVPLPSAGATLFNAPLVFPFDGIDGYSDGPLQTTFNTNSDFPPLGTDGDQQAGNRPWPGADNTNHYFTPFDLLDGSKVGTGANSFTNRIRTAGNGYDTYGRYTFYRMLEELGTDSSPEEGKMNLNYSNAIVTYTPLINGTQVPIGVNVVSGAETNLVPWRPQDFFIAAADKLLRLYTADWFKTDPSNYLATYYGYLPRGHLDATGLGVTNFPNYGVTNQIPTFGITNIPVMVNGRFVYSPAINRLLQLAANLYDATTNNSLDFNLPHTFRPIFERDIVGNVFVRGYTNVDRVAGPWPTDTRLAPPYDVNQITNSVYINQPIIDGNGLVNVYGVPWIIGAKKGLPNFNQFSMVTAAQISRKLEITRTSLDPATAKYGTNEMYVIGMSNVVGVTFWNSYSNDYPRPLTVYVSDVATTVLTNGNNGVGYYTWTENTNFVYSATINKWPGSKWAGTPPAATPQNAAFLQLTWPYIIQTPLSYNEGTHLFDVSVPTWQPVSQYPQLDQFGVIVTNRLQAYILDGTAGNYTIIDYVELRDPIGAGSLNQTLADPNYPQPDGIYYQWSTNVSQSSAPIPYGIINQVWVSGHNNSAPTVGSVGWSTAQTPMGITTPAAEAAYFNGFFTPTFQFNGVFYVNHQLVMQAPYTPSRAVYTSYLMQANDPLVHYLGSDLNAQLGTLALWSGKQQLRNGVWYHSDDVSRQPLPTPPVSPIGGRYQPWGLGGQMMALAAVDTNAWNVAYKDPLAWGPDYWDFPTNVYPTVGWIGRVHRGTPWQTVDLKSTNILWFAQSLGKTFQNTGSNTWANWTGNIQLGLQGQFYDAANASPLEDRLLFDIFTTRFNDNAVRGSLPVNVGVGTMDGGLAAWSALFSGMEVISNLAPTIGGSQVVPHYTSFMMNPAGIDKRNSVLASIVANINATRANTNLFPYNGFVHAGDVLQTPGLSELSPFLNQSSVINQRYGIGDEAYEWLPQQMMGLVRSTEQRYVLYCFGQTLRPAPNGTVLSGSYFQLVTNYQVVAESAARAVIRIDNANTSKPHAVVESYNVLPPN